MNENERMDAEADEDDPRQDFIEFLTSPANPDPTAEIAEWAVYMACPHCGATHPAFHAVEGQTATRCDSCGWGSDV